MWTNISDLLEKQHFKPLRINLNSDRKSHIAQIINTLIICSIGLINTQVHAENWRTLGKSETGEYFFDADSVKGSPDDKKINIKVNVIGEARDGSKSRFLSFAVNCIDSSYLMEALKTYDSIDLSGAEKILNVQNQKRLEAKPKTIGQLYVDAACGKSISAATTNNITTATPASNISASTIKSKLTRPRKAEYIITKNEKRPDGSIDYIEAIDISSAEPDWSSPWQVWFVNVRAGKPVNNNIDSLPIQKKRSNCEDQYKAICKKGQENYLENLSLSDRTDDYKDFLNPSENPNYSQKSASSRVSDLMNSWIKGGDFSNGLYYDIVAFLDVTYYLNREGMSPAIREKWLASRNEFASFITRISAISGAPALDVINYFGFNGEVFKPWGGGISNNNSQYSKKARDDFYLYYQANLDKYKHLRGKYRGFPHDYSPEQLIGDYFTSQFKKYAQKTNELPALRSSIESSMAAAKEAQRKAAEYAASPEGIKKAQQQAAEQKRREEEAAAALNREYPYYAVISCGVDNQHINILACFGGRVGSELEINNGGAYGLYKIHQIHSLGNETREGFVINLKSNFAIKAQNSDNSLILGMKIFKRAGNDMLYQKQVSQWGTVFYKK